PAMTCVSSAPFLCENAGCFVLGKNRLSVMDARGDVVDRKIDPNALQSPEMLVHIAFVAEGADLGEPKKLPRKWPPRSAPAATSSARQKALPDPDQRFFPRQPNRSG